MDITIEYGNALSTKLFNVCGFYSYNVYVGICCFLTGIRSVHFYLQRIACVFSGRRDRETVSKRNERERRRVRLISEGFCELRKHLMIKPCNRKLPKLQILRRAILYIKNLEEIIRESDLQNASPQNRLCSRPATVTASEIPVTITCNVLMLTFIITECYYFSLPLPLPGNVFMRVFGRKTYRCSCVPAHTRKNAQPVQGWWKQPWTMLCCPHCSMLSTILFSIVTPDCRLIQAQQCWTILLTTLNNVGSTTLFTAVFINPEQVVRFLLCTGTKKEAGLFWCVEISSHGSWFSKTAFFLSVDYSIFAK